MKNAENNHNPMRNELNYQLNCSDYVLHEGDKPIRAITQEVALAFDRESGTLHKHGAPEMVQNWFSKTRSRLIDCGFQNMADDLVLITGRFPVEELNKCLSCSGYVLRMYENLQEGKLLPQPEFPTAPAARPRP